MFQPYTVSHKITSTPDKGSASVAWQVPMKRTSTGTERGSGPIIPHHKLANVGQATSQHQEAKSREGESRQGASPTGVSLQAPKSPLGRTLPLAPVCRAQRQPATSRVAIHCEDNQRASAGLTVHSRPMRVQEPPSHAKRAPLALSPSGRSQVAGGTGKEAAEPYHSRMLEGRGSAQM